MKVNTVIFDLPPEKRVKILVRCEDRWDEAVWKIEDVLIREKDEEEFRSVKEGLRDTWQWKRLTSKDRNSYLMYEYEKEVGRDRIIEAVREAWKRLEPGSADIVAN